MARERAPASASAAQLTAWAVASLLAVVLGLGYSKKRLLAYIGSLGLDMSQHLAIGLLIAGAVYLWSRFVPRRGAIWVVPVLLASAGMSALFVAEDLEGAADKLHVPVLLLALALSLLIPASVFVAASKLSFAALRAREGKLRWLPVVGAAAGFAVLVVHRFVLDLNYPGLHLFGTVLGTVFAGACLTGVTLPVVSRRTRVAMLTLLAVVSFSSFVFRPRDSWTVQAMRRTSAVFAPYVARLHEVPIPEAGDVKQGDARGVPPTAPALIDKPTIVFWTIDALRPELLSGEYCARLKNLCALAAESTTFSDARSAAPATTASLTSLFTGRYYSQIYWKEAKTTSGAERLFPHADTSPRFPQILTDAGINTINTGGHAGYVAEWGTVQGFTTEVSEGKTARDIGRLTIKKLKEPGQLFIYAHLLEPHAPYNAKGNTPFEKYVGEVALVDDQLGQLRQAIAKTSRHASTILIVSADHGEAFGEHDVSFHGSTVYDEMIRIPLIVHIPGRAAREVDEPVSLIDVGPTILDLFGQETPATFMGQSLVPLIAGGSQPLERPIVVDSSRGQQAMVSRDGYKVIYDARARTSELYDTHADPGETDDLSDDRPDILKERLGRLRAFMKTHTLKRPGYKKPYLK
jgi:hypothetical protein